MTQQSLKFPQVFYLFRTCQILYDSIIRVRKWKDPIIKIICMAQGVKNNKQKEFESIQICEKCFLFLTLNIQIICIVGTSHESKWIQWGEKQPKYWHKTKKKQFPSYIQPRSDKEREDVRKEGERNVIHNSVFLFAILAHPSYSHTKVN